MDDDGGNGGILYEGEVKLTEGGCVEFWGGEFQIPGMRISKRRTGLEKREISETTLNRRQWAT